MSTHLEAILEQKFRESAEQMARERRRSGILGNIEIVLLIVMIGLFVALLKYIFWGAGFSVFASAQHESSVSLLMNLPGPQSELVHQAVARDGYVSLMDYRNYVEMANEHKALELKALELSVGH